MKQHFTHMMRPLLLATSLISIQAGPVPAQSVRPEYEVKAEFLSLFAQFVKWPPEAFHDTNAPLVIGVLGNDPFGEALDKAVKKEDAVGGRKLVVQRSRDVRELKACHVLFVSTSEKGRLDQILSVVTGSGGGVLTVGETDGFARRGGIINLFLQDNKVRFEINTDAANRSGLKISSQLLSLAKIVGSAKGKEHQ